MGLTKQYLRYAAYGICNIICGRSNLEFIPNSKTKGKLCAVGACENVIIWDLRKGEKVCTLYGENHQVTIVRVSPRGKQLAVGYQDGSVAVYDLTSGNVLVTFRGHKSAVTALNFDSEGMRLVSGAMDTEVVVWDLVNESGLFRLRGHKGIVTQARFMSGKNVLVTSSKDTFVKFWDLDTQHCFKTLVSHRTEVWDFILAPGAGENESKLITGSADMELRVWALGEPSPTTEEGGREAGEAQSKRRRLEEGEGEGSAPGEEDAEEEDVGDMNLLSCVKVGSLKRHGKGRLLSMRVDASGRHIACHGTDSQLELYCINTPQEVAKRLAKRQRKARKRERKQGAEEGVGATVSCEATLEDEIQHRGGVKLSSKIRAFDLSAEKENELNVVGLLGNNSLEGCLIECGEKKAVVSQSTKLLIPGHRTDMRTLCFSSDNTAVMSASGDSVKIWNRSTLQCIRSMACDYALCSLFAPGDRHVLVGTKSGKIQLYDLASGALLETIDAHTAAVWAIALTADRKGLVSGSADKSIKFWEFELVTDTKLATSKLLTAVHTRTLQLTEEVLGVKLSADGRLLAAALLDSTVKVFFVDSLKFFLSLYGHKLPVLCMDISADSTLLVTGSADRNCKIWGLDFGDCHKSIFAHDDSIMCMSFVGKTHMFFTAGKDRTMKEWDADNFEHIQTLKGHHAEIWALAVSPSGAFVASAAHDKSLRVWERTEEPLVLGEEQELEHERRAEEAAVEGQGAVVLPGEQAGQETGMAGRNTVHTIKAAERLMEALELYREETAKREQHEEECRAAGKQAAALPLHPLFQAFNVDTPLKYMLETVKKVKSSELIESLLVLPFSYVTDLLPVLSAMLERGWEVELCCRIIFFLLRIHQGQITSNQVLLPVIAQLRQTARHRVAQKRDTIGFNLAGLRQLQLQLEARDAVQLFTDATAAKRKQKRKQAKRTLLTVKTV